MVPLVIASHGGSCADVHPRPAHLVTARSVEFDALVVLGGAAAAPDAAPAFDAKAGAPAEQVDPRVVKLVQEAFRHSKAIASVAAGRAVLAAAGVAEDAPGVVVAQEAASLTEAMESSLARHRVWDRFAPTSP